jgi:tetratricopeptide (TPR) repeat protein
MDGRYLTLAKASGSGKGTGSNLRQTLTAGTDLPGFTILDCLHEGQFAAVFHARNTTTKEDVALKIMEAADKDADPLLDLLRNDFLHMAAVTDLQHVVRVHQPIPVVIGRLQLVLMPMEFADGGNLRKWMGDNPDVEQRMPEALRMFREVCQGVLALHTKGIIHLDLKPENILLFGNDRTAKVVDAGIARRIVSPRSGLPIPHATTGIGTPEYMSPEQSAANPENLGPASDIYSLGIILFELLTGRRPPAREDPRSGGSRRIRKMPPEITGPGSLWNSVVGRCLSASADDRFPSVEAMLKDFERAARGDPDVACPHCGHVNAGADIDLLRRECQGCGRPLPSDFFRACPPCGSLVRRDLELCPHCRFRIGSHYQAKKLWADICAAKEQDPDRAINLIGMMLAGDMGNRDELLALNKTLLGIQEQIASLRQAADRFGNHGEIERAVEVWNEVLRLAPRHAFATAEARRLRRILDEERAAVATIRSAMDTARFTEAAARLTERLTVTPGRNELLALGEECRNRESGYLAAMKGAERSRDRKQLHESRRHLREALGFASSSDAATRLNAETKRIERNEMLLRSAQDSVASADFSAADKALTEVENSQSDLPALASARSTLDKTRKRYTSCIAAAETAVADADLTGAEVELRKSVAACPRSQSAQKRLAEVLERQALVQSSLSAVEQDLAVADFAAAWTRLKESDRMWPTCPGLAQVTSTVQEREKTFSSSVAAADNTIGVGDLAQAESHLKTALDACPRSALASSRLNGVAARQASVPPLVDAAKDACANADFAAARERVHEAERIWPLFAGLPDVQSLVQDHETKYTDHMAGTDAAIANGDLTLAERELGMALAICPKAEALHAKTRTVQDLKASVPPLLNAARADCEAADFESARTRLERIERTWRSFPDLPKAKTSLQKTQHAYMAHIAAANAAISRGDLSSAETELRLALKTCPRSGTAQTQLDKLLNGKAKIPALLAVADEDSKSARFEAAFEKLRQAASFFGEFPGLSSAREAIETLRSKYEACMERERQTAEAHKLDLSLAAAEDALTLCPQSEEAITAKNAVEKLKKDFEDERRNGQTAVRRAQFPQARLHFENAQRLWPGHGEIQRQTESISETENRYTTALANAQAAMGDGHLDDASAACERALEICPQAGDASALRTKILRERGKADARRVRRHEIQGTVIKIVVTACVVAACVWLGVRVVSRISRAFGGGPRQQTSEPLPLRMPPAARPRPSTATQPPAGPKPSVATPHTAVAPPAAREAPSVRQVTLSNVSIPEDVVKAGDVMSRFYGMAQSNGNVAILSSSDALALEKALQAFATGMDGTVRTHWKNGFDRFRRRGDGENPASFEAQRQESRREAFRQATAAFEQSAATFGIPLIRNRNGQWLGPTWAYCVTQSIYPDGYKPSSRGGGVLKFDLPSRQYVGNRGNWIKLMGSAGKFNGNMSAFGGWVEMMVSGRSEADIYIGRRLDMRLDMLLIPAVQMDANSGNDGMHDFFSSRHGVILGRVRLRMTGDSPAVLFDVPCGADALGTQDLNWKGALNYDAIPPWPTTL